MIDIIFLTKNRLEFTKASLTALSFNTDPELVNRIIVYDDGSTDGTLEYLQSLKANLIRTKFGNPVAIMNSYLQETGGTEIFAKIDNDTMLPPGWLNRCLEVMNRNPELDLLGIEPCWSRKPSPARAIVPEKIHYPELDPRPLGFAPCNSIGGIGLMRRSCFRSSKPNPFSTYGGFTNWQLRSKELVCGWVAPPLEVFLLDRMPTEPWKSLSQEYIRNGWQRPWTNYTMDDKHMWDWYHG